MPESCPEPKGSLQTTAREEEPLPVIRAESDRQWGICTDQGWDPGIFILSPGNPSRGLRASREPQGPALCGSEGEEQEGFNPAFLGAFFCVNIICIIILPCYVARRSLTEQGSRYGAACGTKGLRPLTQEIPSRHPRHESSDRVGGDAASSPGFAPRAAWSSCPQHQNRDQCPVCSLLHGSGWGRSVLA